MSKRKQPTVPKGAKRLVFQWNDEGAWVNRDPTHTMGDVRLALINLAQIVAHNEYMNGGMPPVWRLMSILRQAIFDHLQRVVLDERVDDYQQIPEE
jgi:hypothetical protein